MAGIYIHIPFCKQACHYCDFHFSTSVKSKIPMIDAMVKEMEMRKDFVGKEKIQTLYFGGGTPSLLGAGELERLTNAVRRHFAFSGQIEFTLEANPDDLNEAKVLALAEAGVIG